MPKEPRGTVYPMSDRALEGCDVRPGRGLFASDKYVLNCMNIKREDSLGNSYLFVKGDWIDGSIPRTIYLRSLERALDYKYALAAVRLYLSQMREQRVHPVKMYWAYLVARLTILKWWNKC